jgi:DNA polymerase-3 subunit epsilon
MACDLTSEDMALQLQRAADYRVLRRVAVAEGEFEPINGLTATHIGAVVDVETTGLDVDSDRIIELAIRRIRFDAFGWILKIGQPFFWLEDPRQPLQPDIVRITGLRDEELRGQAIDEARATSLLISASVIISHNAAFDRPFVDDRLPSVRGLPWACTCRDIEWAELGFDGRNLGWLLAQMGWFHDGHRAGADVDALITMLMEELPGDRTPLQLLLEKAKQSGWQVRAVGAHFDVKDRLKARGYRWDGGRVVWWREVCADELDEEREWLADCVYREDLRPWSDGPEVEEVTWTTRYARPRRPPVYL